MLKERRHAERVKKPVYFKLETNGMKERRSVDISLGGLLMESDKLLDVDEKIKIELIIPNQKSIFCQTRVAWAYPRTKNAVSYKIGLQFLGMSAKDMENLKDAIY